MTGGEMIYVGDRREDVALDHDLDQLGRDIERLTLFQVRHHHTTIVVPAAPASVPRRRPVAAIGLVLLGQGLLGATIAGGVDPLLAAATSAVFGLVGLTLVAAQRLGQS